MIWSQVGSAGATRRDGSTKKEIVHGGACWRLRKESGECPILDKYAEMLGMRGRILIFAVINFSTEQF